MLIASGIIKIFIEINHKNRFPLDTYDVEQTIFSEQLKISNGFQSYLELFQINKFTMDNQSVVKSSKVPWIN